MNTMQRIKRGYYFHRYMIELKIREKIERLRRTIFSIKLFRRIKIAFCPGASIAPTYGESRIDGKVLSRVVFFYCFTFAYYGYGIDSTYLLEFETETIPVPSLPVGKYGNITVTEIDCEVIEDGEPFEEDSEVIEDKSTVLTVADKAAKP